MEMMETTDPLALQASGEQQAHRVDRAPPALLALQVIVGFRMLTRRARAQRLRVRQGLASGWTVMTNAMSSSCPR